MIEMKGIFIQQYKKIDEYRPKLVFMLFFMGINILFTLGVTLTAIYPFLFAFLLTPALKTGSTLFYNILYSILKPLTIATPFVITFFMLDKMLRAMLFLQTLEQRLVIKITQKFFYWYWKKHRNDPKMPRQLSRILNGFASINTWYFKRKKWQQYFIVLSLFLFYNPAIFGLFL